MLKAIHAQEGRKAARQKSLDVVRKLTAMKLKSAAHWIQEGIEETFSYCEFPEQHGRKIRTNNPLERLMKEIRRRTRVVGSFPDGESALMLAAARLRHVAGSKWGSMQYLKIERINELDQTRVAA